MSFREFKPTPEAVRRARDIGVYGNTANRLVRAARRACKISHELGNFRFTDLALTIEGNKIVWVNRFDPRD